MQEYSWIYARREDQKIQCSRGAFMTLWIVYDGLFLRKWLETFGCLLFLKKIFPSHEMFDRGITSICFIHFFHSAVTSDHDMSISFRNRNSVMTKVFEFFLKSASNLVDTRVLLQWRYKFINLWCDQCEGI